MKFPTIPEVRVYAGIKVNGEQFDNGFVYEQHFNNPSVLPTQRGEIPEQTAWRQTGSKVT